MTDSQASTVTPTASVSTVALSRIAIEEGFNPRAQIDPVEQRRLEHSIEQRGILQPVLVEPRGDGEYILIDGHRRIEAAAKLGLMEIPISIRSGREDGDNLVDAVVANQLHAHLNPLEEALACRRLIQSGLTRRQVAAKLEMTQATVKERLAILDLPEDLWLKVASTEIPLLAVKALAGATAIHPDFARSAVAAVLTVEPDEEPYTWAEIADNPVGIAIAHSDSLPDGVFRSGVAYPLECFSVSEKAGADVTAYAKLTGEQPASVRFEREDVEQARLLGAAHDYRWGCLIVGQDVAERLLEDVIARALKQERAAQRRERKQKKERGAADGEPASTGHEQEPRSAPDAKAQREVERKDRARAVQYNLDLGVLALRRLLKIKVDERVLRILASMHVTGDLRGLALRGARLALPGWPVQTHQRNGKLKTTYLDPDEAEQRAARFLADAEACSDIAGRSLTLLALASLTDENAVARSRRSGYAVRFTGPWARQAERDLHLIVRERIKEGQLPALDELLETRLAQAEQIARDDEEVHAAQGRLDHLGTLADLDDQDLERALEDARLAWGDHSPKTFDLRNHVEAERDRRQQPAGDADKHDREEASQG